MFKRANQDNWDLTERSIYWWYIYSSTLFCPFELGVGIRGTVNLGATTWTTCDSLRPSDSPNQVRHRSSAVSIKRLKNSTFSSVSKHFFQTRGNKWRNKHHSLKGPACRCFCCFLASSGWENSNPVFWFGDCADPNRSLPKITTRKSCLFWFIASPTSLDF